MIERLFDFLQQFLELFKFWTVIDEYERGVVLTLGRYTRTLEPGIHWIYPLAIDNVLTENVALESKNLGQQSLVTKDGVSIAVGVILSFRIKDIQKYLLEVEEAMDVLMDSTYGTVGSAATAHTWEEVQTEVFREAVYKEIRRKAFSWGIELVTLQFSDLARAKCIRLLNEPFTIER